MKKIEKAKTFYVLKRLLSYMVKNYKFSFLIVVICIVIGAFATMQGMLFVQSLVDDYIMPMLEQRQYGFWPAGKSIVRCRCILYHRCHKCIRIQPYHGQCQSGNDAEIS